jgi:putative toxin-antitoxin system antitoxin component (TIGR02293 family)
MIETGLPTGFVHGLIDAGVTSSEIAQLVISPRTLKHRMSQSESLSKTESARAVRLAQILRQAETVFADRDKALHWLRSPQARYEDRIPLDMLCSDTGASLVEALLRQTGEVIYV